MQTKYIQITIESVQIKIPLLQASINSEVIATRAHTSEIEYFHFFY